MKRKTLETELRRVKSANTQLLGERDRLANRVHTLTECVEALQRELAALRGAAPDVALLAAREAAVADLEAIKDEIRVLSAEASQLAHWLPSRSVAPGAVVARAMGEVA